MDQSVNIDKEQPTQGDPLSPLERLAYPILRLGELSKNKVNVAPGWHLLMCAGMAGLFGAGGIGVMNFLCAQKPIEDYYKAFGASRENMDNHPLSPLFGLYGALKFDKLKHMPLVQEAEKFTKDERKGLAWNEFCKVALAVAPPAIGAIGWWLGSRVYTNCSVGNYQAFNTKNMPDNLLGFLKKIQFEEGNSMGIPSAILASTGGGSLRYFSGTVASMRFLDILGRRNGFGWLGKLLHGKFTDNEFHDAPASIISTMILPELVAKSDAEIWREGLNGYVPRAVRGIIKQLFGSDMATDEAVTQLVDGMLDLRTQFKNSGKADPKALAESIKNEIYGDFDVFLARSGMDPTKADIRGGGLQRVVTEICMNLFGGKEKIQELLDQQQRHAEAAMEKVRLEAASGRRGFAPAMAGAGG